MHGRRQPPGGARPARQPFSHAHQLRDQPLPQQAGSTALEFVEPE